jgi:excisionase family DNA binding protein
MASPPNPISFFDTPIGHLFRLHQLIERGGAKVVGADGVQLTIPDPVQNMLLTILKNMELSKAVSIVAEDHPLTTQGAAEILGVSRPFLVRLLESGAIPFHKVGAHRRIYFHDLWDYKSRRDAAQSVTPG